MAGVEGGYDTEERIVWLGDPRELSYLREGVYPTTQRQGRVGARFYLVAYAECVPQPRHGRQTYKRRFWWLESHDRDCAPDNVYRVGWPSEAVNPLSIRLNQPSEDPVCTWACGMSWKEWEPLSLEERQALLDRDYGQLPPV